VKAIQRGFTLLEVMIAVSIMSVGIVAALELFGGSLHLAGEADKQSKATILANQLIDEMLWRDVLEEGQESDSEGEFDWTLVTQPIDRTMISEDEDPELHEVGDELGLWLIQAEVRWRNPRGIEKSIVLETARIGDVPGEQDF
jgi:type IV pilus modification protein PilV